MQTMSQNKFLQDFALCIHAQVSVPFQAKLNTVTLEICDVIHKCIICIYRVYKYRSNEYNNVQRIDVVVY